MSGGGMAEKREREGERKEGERERGRERIAKRGAEFFYLCCCVICAWLGSKPMFDLHTAV